MNKLLERAKELQPELVENRRWLHSHAEVGFELTETCAFVEEKLRELGYEPRRMSKAGVVATLGKPGGKTILLRADMDALPMKEESGLAFAAKGDAAHTCGHDLHTAMLLGAAKLLKEHESELNDCVKLMFQPDEEGTNPLGFSGRQAMLEDGILEAPPCGRGLLHAHLVQRALHRGHLLLPQGGADVLLRHRHRHRHRQGHPRQHAPGRRGPHQRRGAHLSGL